MSEIKIGSELRDNDKRQKGRIVEVLDLSGENGFGVPTHAHYHTGKRNATIKLSRIHTDGKKHYTGFSLIAPKPDVKPADYQAPDRDPA